VNKQNLGGEKVYQSSKYMTEFIAKKMICDVGKRMYDRGYVASNDGNISVRIGQNAIICTPTGVSKGFMMPDMLVKINMKGEKIAGKLKQSSEVKMHLRVFEENPEVLAVVHAHPPAATSFSIAGIELNQAVLTEAVVLLGNVPIAPYATPGTNEVPDSITPYCKDHNAVLLANHGALTWGADLLEAYHRLESLEHYSKILMYTTRIFEKTNELNCDQVEKLLEIRKKIGIKAGGVPSCSINEKKAETSNDNKKCPPENSVNINTKEEVISSIITKVTENILRNYK